MVKLLITTLIAVLLCQVAWANDFSEIQVGFSNNLPNGEKAFSWIEDTENSQINVKMILDWHNYDEDQHSAGLDLGKAFKAYIDYPDVSSESCHFENFEGQMSSSGSSHGNYIQFTFSGDGCRELRPYFDTWGVTFTLLGVPHLTDYGQTTVLRLMIVDAPLKAVPFAFRSF